MKVLTKEHASRLLNVNTLDIFVGELSGRLPLASGAYSIPADSGAKTALTRLLAHLLLKKSGAWIYVSGWSVWPSSENLDLFYGYRQSLGETRYLIDAPVHVFEGAEHDALVSILCMVFYFVWDAWVFDPERRTLVRVSHDGWLEVRVDDDEAIKGFIVELEKFGLLLAGE